MRSGKNMLTFENYLDTTLTIMLEMITKHPQKRGSSGKTKIHTMTQSGWQTRYDHIISDCLGCSSSMTSTIFASRDLSSS